MSSGVKRVPRAGSLATWEQIEPLCVAFEEAWRHGVHPSLEEYMRLRAELSGTSLLFDELLRIELFYRQSAGEVLTRDNYCARFPEFGDVIERVFASQPLFPRRSDFVADALIGRYRIVQELGRGSFGVVYLAHDQELNRDVAIKIPGDGQRATSQQLTRLLEEVRAAASLRHPAIVAVYDVQPLADGGMFAVLEYVAGRPLRDYAAAHQPEIAAKLFASISDAIAYAHRQGFVHRDLHPGNILIDDMGAPHVADFGLAVHEDTQRQRAGERAGSLLYMSPEQVRGETHRLDGRADIWAVGVMLYEVLAGRPPFQGETPQQVMDEILHRDPKPPRQIRAETSLQLEAICLRCLAKQPEDRFATAGDLANALRSAEKQPRISRRTWFVSSAALLIATAAAWNLWQRPPGSTDGSASADPVHVDVLIWKSGRWNSVSVPGVLPLRSGDQLRIEARSSRPRYLYVVWIDVQQTPSAIFPWQRGDWQRRSRELARNKLHLPEGASDAVWPMRVTQTGCEMLLLLARPTPLPKDINVAKILQGLPTLSDHPAARTGARFDYVSSVPLSRYRDFDVARTSRIHDPFLELQRELQTRLQPHFPEMEALLLPIFSVR